MHEQLFEILTFFHQLHEFLIPPMTENIAKGDSGLAAFFFFFEDSQTRNQVEHPGRSS